MRKTMMRLATAAGLATLAASGVSAQSAGAKKTYDLTKPDEALQAERRMHCSLEDGRAALYWWHGRVYSRIEGERDRLLFNVHGWSARACKTFQDATRGYGYRSVNRELLIYLDKDTNQVLRTWKNPWTGEEVEVLHVANDPVNMREPTYARDKEGQPYRPGSFAFEELTMSGGGAARLFYTNPLAGDYQEHVGGTYHAMEFGTNAIPTERLADASLTEVGRNLTWVRVSKWLPWMKMGDRQGFVIFHTAGTRVSSIEDVPEPVRTEIRTNYAAWLQAPPLDDTRPNMTSWDQFKRHMEAKKAKAGGRE
jgi:hypothetical protein